MLILYVYCDIVGYKKKQPDSLPSGGQTYLIFIDSVQKITPIRHYHNGGCILITATI